MILDQEQCVSYLVKYVSKYDFPTSQFQRALDLNVDSSINENFSRASYIFQKLAFSQDKSSIQAAFTLKKGTNVYKTNFNHVKVYLKGHKIFRQCQNGELSICHSIVGFYVKRNSLSPNFLTSPINSYDLLSMSLNNFVSKYYVYQGKLKLRVDQDKLIVVFYATPMFGLSDRNSTEYHDYCFLNFIIHEIWEGVETLRKPHNQSVSTWLDFINLNWHSFTSFQQASFSSRLFM